MRAALAFLVTLLAATAASAADLSVSVRTPQGRPVTDAVITVYPAGGTPSGPIRFDWPYRMVQQNMQFDPFVLIVPVGADVTFPNRDNTRHHVYSFSPAKSFELKLYGREDSRSVHFPKAGVVAVGCNIHDSMVAFIKVVDTPYAAKTAATGFALLHGVPAGQVTVRIWHPYLRAPGNEIVRTVTVTASGQVREAVVADIRAPVVRRHGY